MIFYSDILTALKGYFFKADHRFVVYRFHCFIASGCPPRSVRPAIDHGLCLQPLTPILNGLRGYVECLLPRSDQRLLLSLCEDT